MDVRGATISNCGIGGDGVDAAAKVTVSPSGAFRAAGIAVSRMDNGWGDAKVCGLRVVGNEAQCESTIVKELETVWNL